MKKRTVYISLLIWLITSLSVFAQTSKLRVYAFFDLETEWNSESEQGKNWTFDQHHFNVLSSYTIDDQFRVFSEIEWEHGPSHDNSETTGTIYLARAYLDYRYSEALKIMAGKFLPPFGIYNERHDATPTFLFTLLPNSIYRKHANPLGKDQRIFSKFITGLQVNGLIFTGDWEFEYAVYAGNGRGNNPGEKDDNANKGLGTHLKLSPQSGKFIAGFSFYQERNGLANNTLQRVLAIDAQILEDAFQIEIEGALPSQEKVDGDEKPIGDMQNGAAFYVQTAVPFTSSLTPFARFEYFDPDTDLKKDDDRRWVAGLNYAVTPSVYLKSEWHSVQFSASGKNGYNIFISSVAVVF